MTRFGLILVFGSLLIGESLAATLKPVTKSLTPLADAAATQNDAERDKRGLDLGLLLRNVLLKSADLSNYKADVSRAKAAKVTTTRAPRKRPTTRKPTPFVPLQKPFPPPFGGYGPVKVSISGPSAQAYGPPNGFRGPSGPALAPFGKAGFHNYANYDDDDYDYDYDGNLLVASGAQATTTSTTIRPTGKRRKPGQRNNLPYGPPAPFYGSPSGRFNKQGGYMYFENAYNNARRQQQAAGQNANNQQPQQEQQQPAAGNGGGGTGTGTVTRQQLTNKLLYQYAQQDDIYSNNAKSAAAKTAGDGGANASNSSPQSNNNDNNNNNSNNNDVQYLNINPNASDDDEDDDEDDDDNEDVNDANDEIYNTQNKNIYDYNTPKTNNNNNKNYEYRNDYNDAEDGEDIAQPIANPASTLTAPEYTNQNIDTTPQKPPYYIAAGEETYELPSAFGLQQQQQEEPYHYFVLRPTEQQQQQQQQAIDQLSPQLEPVNSQYQNYGTGSDNGGNGGGNGGSDVAIAFNDFETSHNSDPRYTSYTTVHK